MLTKNGRSVVGQLLFGYLADRYGRTRLYGIELVLVIVSTIGVATSSNGYSDLSFLALFTWVRRRRIGVSSLVLLSLLFFFFPFPHRASPLLSMCSCSSF